jgi:hypothetical protein
MIDNSLEAFIVNKYFVNRFCIFLDKNISLIDSDNIQIQELPEGTQSVLFHEYYHYLTNISTVYGWESFFNVFCIFGIFSNSLDDFFQIDPSLFSFLHKQELILLTELITLQTGNPKIFSANQTGIKSITLKNLSSYSKKVGIIDFQVAKANFEITHKDEKKENKTVIIGASLIEEGITYILEASLRNKTQTFIDSQQYYIPPVYPYLSYQYICQFICPDISPIAAVKIGLLALNYSNPGFMLIKFLKKFKKIKKKYTKNKYLFNENIALEILKEEFIKTQRFKINRVINEQLFLFEKEYNNRGFLANGSLEISNWFKLNLQRRLQDIWFDVNWLNENGVNFDKLNCLISSIIPCDVIQGRNGDEHQVKRDLLLTFSKPFISSSSYNGIRAIQAQHHCLLSHLKTDGFKSNFEEKTNPACPYYSSCNLDFRKKNATVCYTTPWETRLNQNVCWYGWGAQAFLSDIK